MDKTIEVRAFQDPITGRLDIAIIETVGKTRSIMKPVMLEMETIDEAKRMEPSFSLPEPYAKPFLKAWGKAADGAGLPPDSTELMRGHMEAQGAHLEDLRHMLKLPKKTPPKEKMR